MSSTQPSRPRRRLARPSLGALIACGAVGAAGALLPTGGCAQTPITVPTRALERSGRSAFVCLGAPNGAVRPQLPLEECKGTLVTAINQYVDTSVSGVSVIPHLYALVTQTTRGEIAVIDTTATQNSVLDEDPSIPGASFLPVGAQPIDIVSTPGGTATFVGVAEVGREALFALPSAQIRPSSSDGVGGSGGGSTSARPPPEISSWPACRLPSAPGAMLLLNDPPNEAGAVRTSCDATSYSTLTGADPALDLGAEGKGRQKLVVAMPELGGLVVIDAQTLLDTAPGSFGECPVERWLPLATDVPSLPLPPPESGPSCVSPEVVGPMFASDYPSRPSGLAYAAGRLYVSDLAAPIIHVIDLPSPCEPVEIAPLVPTSVEDSTRVVTTSHIAVTPSLTPALKRYLYAIDAGEGSAMVFDVSDDSKRSTPLQRPNAEWNPFDPPDRIRYAAPASDLIMIQRDVPATNPATGVAPEGVRCDPSPTLRATCTDPTSQTCDVSTAYRTSSTYDSGAGPRKLRGTFAMMSLTSGRVAVIDVDDYDAPCRVPPVYSSLLGCDAGNDEASALCTDGKGCTPGTICQGGVAETTSFCTYSCSCPTDQTECASSACTGGSYCLGGSCGLASSAEASCNMVLPNAPRAGIYAAAGSVSGQHVPGVTIFPLLYDLKGTLVGLGDGSSPRMVATVPKAATAAAFALSVGGVAQRLDPGTGTLAITTTDGDKHVLAMNLEDPRAHLADQNWYVTYEGTIPGFDQKVASLVQDAEAIVKVSDANSRFCDAGVHSESAVRAKLGLPESTEVSAMLSDYVQITTSIVDQTSNYWQTDATGVCTYQECLGTFGDLDAFQTTRDLRITEAYQDHLDVTTRDPTRFYRVDGQGQLIDKNGNPAVIDTKDPEKDTRELATPAEIGRLTHCCFPGTLAFTVRVGNQWSVQGDASGFLHHVIADPATGVCRDSCDARLTRRNGRVAVSARNTKVTDDGPGAFINPMFRMAILDDDHPTPGDAAKRRDYQFRFTTQGAFSPLVVDLATDSKTLISPVGMTYLRSTGDLAVTDGSINGLLLVNLSSVSVTRQFF